MNLFYQPLIPDGHHHLDPEESKHCVKALRKREGDVIVITDGKGFFYEATIQDADAHRCTFTVIGQKAEELRPYHLHIAISPTKNADRLEWFVEKAVEIGVDHVTLLDCSRTERSYTKMERLEKIAISAMKQSLKATLPLLSDLTPFNDVISQPDTGDRFIAFVDQENPISLQDVITPAARYIVLIGPEGDFTPSEVTAALAAGYQKVSLGKSRLRTETAGVVACHTFNLLNS